MAGAPIVFDNVSKKFRRGERHDSLRDLLPALVHGAFGRRKADVLERDEFWAVRDVSFEVKSGEALGIIGSNGAGKSTTLKILNRILKPTSGRCLVKGRVGALIEVAAGFHPDLTGRENVYLQGAIMGMSRADIAARFDQIVEFAEIPEFIDTPVKRYSSGMNARLGFSIAAHLKPDVLIIDEVLSVGDMRFQEKCVRRMEEFLRQGTAIAFVSHNLSAVRQLCSRALMLRQGAVAAFGPSEEVISDYGRAQIERTVSSSDPVDIDFEFTDRNVAEAPVRSGGAIPFKVGLRFRQDFRGLIGIVVWDLAKGLYVYGVASDSSGVGQLDVAAGTYSEYEFVLAGNLARGSYVIEINVFDSAQQQHIARLNPAGTFTVVERDTYNSIANLFLSGKEVETSRRAVGVDSSVERAQLSLLAKD